MTSLALQARAIGALVRRDLVTFLSYRTRVISLALGSLFGLALFHFISRLVRVEQFETPDEYYAFVVVGLVILQPLTSTLGTGPSVLRQELVAGTFERLVLSPFGPVGSMMGLLVFPLLLSLFTGVVTLSLAGLVFGLDIRWDTAALAIPISALGALAFAPFGLAMLGVGLMVKQAVSGTTWVIAGVTLVSGLYFPVSLLPDWIEWASYVQPFTPAVNLLRNVLVGTPLPDPAWLELLRITGFAIVLLPAAAAFVNFTVRFAHRRGSLIEY